MSQHFKLTNQEFLNNANLFKVLEIKAKQVVGKDYEELSNALKKQYRKLILVHHPDKGGDAERFKKLDKAYKKLNAYIKPLESGNPCVEINVDAESDGRLTAREFHYRKKLFDELKISEEEAVGKDFDQLISILKKNSSSFERDFNNLLYVSQSKPSMRLWLYILPLKKHGSLIKEDKQALMQKFIKRRDNLLGNVQKSVSNGIFSSTQFSIYLERKYQVET